MKKLLFLILLMVLGSLWLKLNGDHDEASQMSEPPLSEVLPSEESDLEANITETESSDVVVIEAASKVEVERFFYNQLDEGQQEIYRTLRDGIARSDEEIQLDIDDIEEVQAIFRFILYDYPEFFWVTGTSLSRIYQWTDGRSYMFFKPEYGYSGAQKEAMQDEIEEAVEAFLATVEPELSEYERVQMVYEYIILTTSYNLEAPNHQNIYSVFVNRQSVCAGFSRAAQLLLNRLGVFATYVSGTAYVPGTSNEPIAHAWNLVRIDGAYYYLDVTWGSPIFQDGSGLHHSGIIYDYLLVSEDMLFRTHTLSEGIEMPPATSLRHNFFVMNDMFYEWADEERILESMNTSIRNQEEWIAFKFATPELFQMMRPIILDDLARQAARNLAEWYDLDQVQFFIREKENLNKITIYWMYE